MSFDDHEALAAAIADPDRDVRISLAKGLGTVGHPSSAKPLARLARDPDKLVRAAAWEAASGLAADPELTAAALEAAEDAAWQVRKGAALAVGGLAPGSPSEPSIAAALISLLGDEHADVRKAAVDGLKTRTGHAHVDHALAKAADDSDADVRAYARRLISGP